MNHVRLQVAKARARVWGRRRPVAGQPGGQVTIDMDATLVTAHSDNIRRSGCPPHSDYPLPNTRHKSKDQRVSSKGLRSKGAKWL